MTDAKPSRIPPSRKATGSIVRVNFAAGRWEAIPKALIDDPALSVEARWLAIWLIARGPRWELRAHALPGLLKDQSRRSGGVGRDLVRRMLRELQTAGYLVRTRRQEPSGRWVWDSCLNPTKHVVSTIDGPAVDGGAVDGEGVDRIQTDLNSKRNYLKRTTTTRGERVQPEGKSVGVVPLNNLEFPTVLSGDYLASAQALIRRCPEGLRQAVLDEVEAIHQRGKLRNRIGLLSSLVHRACKGEFVSTEARRRLPPLGLPRQPVAAIDAARNALADLRKKMSSEAG